MLKKYLQALLEAFIGSKKEWISDQSMPSDRLYLDANLKSYVAPCNGKLFAYHPGYSGVKEIFVNYNSHYITRASISSTSAEIACFGVEMPKGSTATINSTTPVSELWFSADKGAR